MGFSGGLLYLFDIRITQDLTGLKEALHWIDQDNVLAKSLFII
jgi:hypothetical protein